MSLSVFLGALSGIVYVLGYVEYNRHITQGSTRPNLATWSVFSALALVSAVSYIASSGDFWKGVIPLANIGFCIATFIRAWHNGTFAGLDSLERASLAIGIAAAIAWGVFKSAAAANLIVQFAIAVGFVSTWRGVWKNPSREHPNPWLIWTLSYSVAILVVALRWKGQWIDLAYPVNCIVLHASVPILGSLRKKTLETTLKPQGGSL